MKNQSRTQNSTFHVKSPFCKLVMMSSLAGAQTLCSAEETTMTPFCTVSLAPFPGPAWSWEHVLPIGHRWGLLSTSRGPAPRQSDPDSRTTFHHLSFLASSLSLHVPASIQNDAYIFIMKTRETFHFLVMCIKFNFILPPMWEEMWRSWHN